MLLEFGESVASNHRKSGSAVIHDFRVCHSYTKLPPNPAIRYIELSGT